MRRACQWCGNVEWLYAFRHNWACENCIELGNDTDRLNFAAPTPPMNMPSTTKRSEGKRGEATRCEFCGMLDQCYEYAWPGADGDVYIYACGWKCAGRRMDVLTEQARLIEDEAYVRKSLGIKENA